MKYTIAIALLAIVALLLFGCASQGNAPQAPAGGNGQVNGGNEQPPAPPSDNGTQYMGAQNPYPGVPNSNETALSEGSNGEIPADLPIDSGN